MAAERAVRQKPPDRDISVLTRSVENVFRNLVRLLMGKMTLRRLQGIMREIFVQEAETRLRQERPGRNVPLSRLALLTGLDTRTLIRVRGEMSARQAEGRERIRIEDLSGEARVLEMWARNGRYHDEDTGRPKALNPDEFEQLVKEVISARGVTVQSILERLIGTGSVEVDPKSGVLSLTTDRYSPFDSEDQLSLVASGMHAIINLTRTVDHNVHSAQEERNIQREVWTFRLEPERRDEFHAEVRNFLLRIEDQAVKVMTPLESDTQHDDQITAGVGFYYFEEESDS